MFDPVIYDHALPQDREPDLCAIVLAIRLAGGTPGRLLQNGKALEVIDGGQVVETVWLGEAASRKALVGK